MITLEIEKYCENCPYFVPETLKNKFIDGYTGTNISCQNAEKCNLIYKYIKKENGKND